MNDHHQIGDPEPAEGLTGTEPDRPPDDGEGGDEDEYESL